jgi:predicted Zn-dependent peptidase
MLLRTDVVSRRSFQVHEHQLANGLKALFVENPAIPTISINASVLTGARYDPEEKAGLALMVSRLLDEGTKNRSSLEIAEAIESVGGAIETDGSFERVVVSISILKKDLDLGLDLLSDLLINPIFPQDYVEKEKERTLSEIASAKDRPQVLAGWAFNELIYTDHPLHCCRKLNVYLPAGSPDPLPFPFIPRLTGRRSGGKRSSTCRRNS